MIFRKYAEPFFYSEKKFNKISSKKIKLFLKNLLIFLKLDKNNLVSTIRVMGIKFLFGLKKMFTKVTVFKEAKFFHAYDSMDPIYYCSFLTSSKARFYFKREKIKRCFSEILQIEKILLSKIYLEESADELKTYLDEKLILTMIKNNPLICNCWLGLESNPKIYRNFWFQIIFSCFNFMTTVESHDEKILAFKSFEFSRINKRLKDSDFEYLQFMGKKHSYLSIESQNKKYLNDINFLSKHYQTYKIQGYLNNINWRNRVFKKKILKDQNSLYNAKKNCNGPELFLY